ncbi:MAG: hypothetical protein WC959_01490 [Kiritimatiellales bacterium]
MKNPYGINKTNDIAFVDDVKRGLACECVCPLCHKPFRACQGEKNEHYFAHQDASECAFSYRAALLRMVTDYLRSGELEIPPVIARYLNEEEIVLPGETVRFDRVEQVGDVKAPELHCYLGERSWVLKPVFDKKGRQDNCAGCLTLDLTRFSNPYESRPHQTLEPVLHQENLLRWKNHPKIAETEQALREKHEEKQTRFFRSRNVQPLYNRPRPASTPPSQPSFTVLEEPLPCKFCKQIIQPKNIFMTHRSAGYCVCKTCNKERGGDIHA